MFAVKQLVGALATPLAIAMLMAAVAVLMRLRGHRRAAMSIGVLALAAAYLCAINPVSNALLASLESRYPPLREAHLLPPLAGVVVLGSGYAPRDGIPITATFDEDGLARVIEGIRLSRRLHISPLILSGGAPPGIVPSAIGYARLAHEMGVPEATLMVLDKPLDTGQEAQQIARLLGTRPFLLVTSASHMPRAMQHMRRVGAHPIPAPTGHRSGMQTASIWRNLIPTGAGVRRTERALHEYLGLGALWLGLD